MVVPSAPLRAKHSTMLKLLNKKLVTKEYVESQFIQKSIVPTFHFQPALPRLPVPKLNLTCDRYLAAQRPLLIDESYRKVESDVLRFRDGVGKQLQKLLIDFDNANKHTSYISEMWFDKYLKNRTELPIAINPVLVLNNDERPEYNDQLTRATNLIVSSLRFYKALNAELLEPEVYHMSPQTDNETYRKVCSLLPARLAYVYSYFNKAYPLDMSQFPSLFNTTRVPETDKDRLVTVNKSSHITVQFRGNFYYVPVLSVSGDIEPAEDILAKLKYIVTRNDKPAEFPIGVLTTLERNKWATVRHNLIENNNSHVFKLIDSALFNVCLDESSVGEDPIKLTRLFLHGDGSNRWFDKSFSLILSKDGVAGVNFEHSWGDGVAVLRYSQDIYKDSRQNPRVAPGTEVVPDSSVEFLEINLNDDAKSAISGAKKQYKQVCDNLDMNYVLYHLNGKALCKANNVSPDSVMQLAFQVAYHKLTGNFVSTYESCSTAAFKHGRTETIRPCTVATKNYALANNVKKASVEELKQLMKVCSEVHNRLIREAAMGQGFDRHLFALKTLGERNGISSNLFDDLEYKSINHDILSTSTLNSPAIYSGGFGPVVHDGYGIGYYIRDDSLGVLVTNYRSDTNGKDMIGAMDEAFSDIFKVLKV